MNDSFYMNAALSEAKKAMDKGEIPVGAVMVKDGEIIGRGANDRSINASPFGHAELLAMSEAATALKSWRFDDCTLYVTLEPCVMCAGAVMQCRLKRLVYGAADPKGGACGSLYDIAADSRMYHRCSVSKGVLQKECAELLSEYFLKKRASKKALKQPL